MNLLAIDERNVPEAIALLSRGFPERPVSFWKESLERLSAYRRATNGPPIGRILMVRDQPVGVILTIASKHSDGTGERDVVNLSSWYIENKYRWLAPRMLESIVADDGVVFTSLTPIPQVARINEQLGFRTSADAVLLYFLPWTALMTRSNARLVPFDDFRGGVLSATDRDLLARHQDLGCIAAVACAGGRCHPLLFQPARRKGLPMARLLLAPSRQVVAEHMGAIARFLLRRGVLFLSLRGDCVKPAAGGIVWNRAAPMQVKGKWELDRIDYTYSELVFLRL